MAFLFMRRERGCLKTDVPLLTRRSLHEYVEGGRWEGALFLLL